MYLYFGIVKKYLSEKGFGFLSHPINLGPEKDLFFHITRIERYDVIIAKSLIQNDNINHICFWYLAETTHKGEQLNQILTASAVFELEKDNPEMFIDKITTIWENIDRPIPFWLKDVTLGLVGPDRMDDFKVNRTDSIANRDEKQKSLRIEEERLRQIEEKRVNEEREQRAKEKELSDKKRAEELRKYEENRRQQDEEQERQRIIEEEEFEQLVAEMKPKEFTQSSQVSSYIVRHRLGNKYKNISGLLKMENGHSTWNFNGGFPPHLYRRLCMALGLGNKGTSSKVIGFTSFKNL